MVLTSSVAGGGLTDFCLLQPAKQNAKAASPAIAIRVVVTNFILSAFSVWCCPHMAAPHPSQYGI
jgi:hypothetical protein